MNEDNTEYGVAGIDMNMTYWIYNYIISSFPNYDHYYTLNTDYEVLMHSKLNYIT